MWNNKVLLSHLSAFLSTSFVVGHLPLVNKYLHKWLKDPKTINLLHINLQNEYQTCFSIVLGDNPWNDIYNLSHNWFAWESQYHHKIINASNVINLDVLNCFGKYQMWKKWFKKVAFIQTIFYMNTYVCICIYIYIYIS